MLVKGLMDEFERIAEQRFDGHYTILRFTTNVRIGFGTPNDVGDFNKVPAFPDFRSALLYAIAEEPTFY